MEVATNDKNPESEVHGRETWNEELKHKNNTRKIGIKMNAGV